GEQGDLEMSPGDAIQVGLKRHRGDALMEPGVTVQVHRYVTGEQRVGVSPLRSGGGRSAAGDGEGGRCGLQGLPTSERPSLSHLSGEPSRPLARRFSQARAPHETFPPGADYSARTARRTSFGSKRTWAFLLIENQRTTPSRSSTTVAGHGTSCIWPRARGRRTERGIPLTGGGLVGP